MTPEEEIKKLMAERDSLRSSLDNILQDKGGIKDIMGQLKDKMPSEMKQLEKAQESFGVLNKQLSHLTSFLASPEAKKAMEKFYKDK